MAYLKESTVRAAAGLIPDVKILKKSYEQVLAENVAEGRAGDTFDVFLSHSIKDSEIVVGAKNIIESSGRTVYIDWIVDPSLDRAKVTGTTASKLRDRMRQCRSLLYLYSKQSVSSRWMPWELGYFDGFNGNVAVFPILPDTGDLSFVGEEYLQIYPKVDVVAASLFVNKSASLENSHWMPFDTWTKSDDKLRVAL